MADGSNSNLKIVFGAMTLGKPNTLGARVYSLQDADQIITKFQDHGHSEIDTARLYGGGSSEEMLADLDWQGRKLVMGTKLYPNYLSPLTQAAEKYSLRPDDIRRGVMNSLKALKTDKFDLFYLHGPDRKTPLEETMREVNALHKEGYFSCFGVSNFMSWEVAKICEICENHGWIKPTVYQGIYSALHRSIESELIPCLHHYGIALYAFQPLAGGFLTGRYRRDQEEFEAGSRFDAKGRSGTLHRQRYWNDAYFDALDTIRAAADKHGLTVAEVAFRWLKHHSQLQSALDDAIIIGASNLNQLEGNLVDLEKGPLPEDVVGAMESAWSTVKGVSPKYFH
ncbi:hypothetical protein CNMCM7691_003365 [Aspergillus felis]|uniref:NADP-dependent oxidoreductase domain-containing protein n=1 Tax=Aspergillus felis TaxID=1287682 RepID=A0A8H6QLF5_9EURO|nr:hypothetical protein CNMCM7691_003365 [Aspergillus felis]